MIVFFRELLKKYLSNKKRLKHQLFKEDPEKLIKSENQSLKKDASVSQVFERRIDIIHLKVNILILLFI